MPLPLNYKDVATFIVVTSGDYANSKVMSEQHDVNVIFEQDTNFQHASNQDGLTSDAVCWPDPTDEFIVAEANRLEGMYIAIDLFGENSWYKIESCTVHRNHLLGNSIDNIELSLKKSSPIPNVS